MSIKVGLSVKNLYGQRLSVRCLRLRKGRTPVTLRPGWLDVVGRRQLSFRDLDGNWELFGMLDENRTWVHGRTIRPGREN